MGAAKYPRMPHDPCTIKFLSAAACSPRATLVALTSAMELGQCWHQAVLATALFQWDTKNVDMSASVQDRCIQ